MKKLFFLLVFSLGCNAPESPPAPITPPPVPQYLEPAQAKELINKEDLSKIVYWLADDERAGREPGTAGNEQACKFVEHRYKELKLEPQSQPFLNTRNVYTVIKGKTENVIVIGGHIDHLGKRWAGTYKGSDDNASGTAAVLELAESLCELRQLNHTILFYNFNAEEKGLLGSVYAVKNHPIGLDKIKIMFNFDMIGRLNNILYIYGGHRSEILKRSEDQLEQAYQVSIKTGDSGGSDHVPYTRASIPYLFFHTGLHPDYHKVTDTPDKINYEGMERIIRLAFDLVLAYDNMNITEKYNGRLLNAVYDRENFDIIWERFYARDSLL